MDLFIVLVVVGLALGYAALQAWRLFRPDVKSGGCGCGHAKAGCSGCPLVKP